MPHPFLDARADAPVQAIAHRGGAWDGRENTLVAFESAVRLGYRQLETDVHATADGVLVIAHDADLVRVAGHPGHIAQMTAREVSEVRVAGSEPVPTLAEALAAFPAAQFTVELKADAAVAPMLRLLGRQPGLLARVGVGAFSAERIRPIRRAFGARVCTQATSAEIGRLMFAARTGRRPGAFAADLLAVPERYPVSRIGVGIVARRLLEMADALGLPVDVWTVNAEARMRALVGLGVAGIITDEVLLLQEVLIDLDAWGPV
jgi:glycerophosphoryl diester phosphodiesterase